MATDGRAGAAVTCATPIVRSFFRARGQRSSAFRETGGGNGNVVQHPMHPDSFRSCGIRSVWIVHDQRKAFCLRWNVAPRKGRGNVFALTSVLRGNFTLMIE